MADDPLADLFATEAQSSDPLADLFPGGRPAPAPQVGMTEGLIRKGFQGGTFGTADEIEAGLRTGFGYLGDYTKTRNEIRGKNAAFDRQHPVLSTVAEVVGSLPTVMVPGMGGANLTRAVAQGGMRGIALNSANVGGRTAAAHGAGSADTTSDSVAGSLAQRVPNALTHGALGAGVGYVAGPAINAVARGVGNLARSGSEAIRDSGSATAHANRTLQRDQTNPQQLIDDLLPTYGRGATTMPPQQIETILTRYGESLGQGLDDLAARRVAVAELLTQNPGMNQRTAENQVRQIVQRWDERHQIPMQLHELPALREGSTGYNSNMAMRVAMNRSNEGADPFRAALRERQLGFSEDAESIVARALGGRDADEILIAARDANKVANRGTYGAAEQADEAARGVGGVPMPNGPTGNLPAVVPGVQPIDLTPDLINQAIRYRDRAGPVASGMNQAIELFFEPNTRTGVRTLRQFIDQKMELDQLIQTSMRPGGPGGRAEATTLTAELTNFKNRLMQTVGSQNPLYAQANRAAAEGFSEIRAGQMARDLALTAGPKSRRVLREFETMTPPQQDMVRVMFAQNIADKLVNKGRTHDSSRLFDTVAARRNVRAVLGDDAASDLLGHMDRIGVASRSHKDMGGAQTTPLAQAIKDRDFGAVIQAAMSHLNITKLPEKIGEFAARRINSRSDAELLRILGTSTERPDEILGALRQLMAQQQQQQARNAVPPLQGLQQQLAPFAAIAPERAFVPDN